MQESVADIEVLEDLDQPYMVPILGIEIQSW